MLFGGRNSHSSHTDSFKTAVIDTIVAEVQNVPGEDRCILLLGYETQMREMFQVSFSQLLHFVSLIPFGPIYIYRMSMKVIVYQYLN